MDLSQIKNLSIDESTLEHFSKQTHIKGISNDSRKIAEEILKILFERNT